ncbi:MAG: phosphoribosylaminoimidazolesuccinocarboxamide synthase [Nevskia sp.]|jgi:phosphoribosylaminoimidazole-succinocarboxamide synthase|nr:phosphoribosylaminoimidazolesuccinocarboxamide synthase [Nevskia sp.]MCK9386212.1 phosphoribosylaminoimidazolesuccinocarboxamide synthase [Nevskia sp.]
MTTALHEPTITSLPKIHSGKVRDLFQLGQDHLLIVTSDRLSAFDVVLPQAIPGKGTVLNALTAFWMDRFQPRIRNHLDTTIDLARWLTPEEFEQCRGRAVVAKKLRALPVEAVARGYLIGSGWKDYQATGAVCGIALPPGLQLASKLPEAIFTPAFKAPKGEHDANIDYLEVEKLIGPKLAAQVRELTLLLYREAADYAAERGIIIADTKFEFGVDAAGTLHLIDEVLTPDSSRFWPADGYRVGISPPSFDKQYVRDYLETLDWNKQAPGPSLPDAVITRTAQTYRTAQQLLTGS